MVKFTYLERKKIFFFFFFRIKSQEMIITGFHIRINYEKYTLFRYFITCPLQYTVRDYIRYETQ